MGFFGKSKEEKLLEEAHCGHLLKVKELVKSRANVNAADKVHTQPRANALKSLFMLALVLPVCFGCVCVCFGCAVCLTLAPFSLLLPSGFCPNHCTLSHSSCVCGVLGAGSLVHAPPSRGVCYSCACGCPDARLAPRCSRRTVLSCRTAGPPSTSRLRKADSTCASSLWRAVQTCTRRKT